MRGSGAAYQEMPVAPGLGFSAKRGPAARLWADGSRSEGIGVDGVSVRPLVGIKGPATARTAANSAAWRQPITRQRRRRAP